MDALICSRCNTRFPIDVISQANKIELIHYGRDKLYNHIYNFNLCPHCMRELMDWLYSGEDKSDDMSAYREVCHRLALSQNVKEVESDASDD